MIVVLHPKTGKPLLSPDEAAKLYGCSPANLRKLAQAGEIKRYIESPRRVYYYPDEVERLSRAKEAARKARGGRPRKSDQTA